MRPNASKKGQIGPSTTVWAARGDGSCPNLASVLQEGRKIASIHASSGAIWRIPVIYDYVDEDEPMLAKMASKREAGSKALGYEVTHAGELFSRETGLPERKSL